MKIVYLILQYMAVKDTIECIESINKLKTYNNEIEIVVVDNHSPDDSYNTLIDKFAKQKNLYLIQNDKNLGFANGNNVGFIYAKNNLNPDLIVMINNDTLITQNNFNKILIEKYKEIKFDIAGPTINTAKEELNQNPIHYKKPTVKDIKKKIIKNSILMYASYFNLDLKIQKINRKINYTNKENFEDYMLHGSCLIFGKNYINNYDGLCNKTFLYGEEDILKFTAIKDNLKMIYIKELEIYHKEDVSTDLMFKKKRAKRTFYYKHVIKSAGVLLDIIKKEKTNILFVNHENNMGGATKSLLNLIDELKICNKYNIYVYVPKFNENLKNGNLVEELKSRNVKYLYFRGYWQMYPKNTSKLQNYIKQVFNIFAAIRLSVFIKNKKINIIHSNSSVTSIGLYASIITKVPHIYHLREFGEEDHGYYFVFNKDKVLKLMNKYTNYFICISNSIKEKYEKIFNNMCKIVYNGLSLNYSYKKNKIKKNMDYNLLIAGRIKESKGQLDAVKAINVLIKKGYNKLTLYIVGVADEKYLEDIKEFIKKNNLQDNIVIKDNMSNLDEFRKNIDIELICSKKEAFGRVTIEAMFNSNPIIGINTGATKELIHDMKTGLLYNGNYIDLAKKIELIINDNALRKNISINAYNYAKKNYHISITASKIDKLYEDLIK